MRLTEADFPTTYGPATWARGHRNILAGIKAEAERAEAKAKRLLADKNLKPAAVKALVKGLRATVAMKARDRVVQAHKELHKGLPAYRAKLREQLVETDDANLRALHRRLDVFGKLKDHELVEALRTDPTARRAFANASPEEAKQLAERIAPVLPRAEIEQLMLADADPQQAAALAEAEQAARDVIKTAMRYSSNVLVDVELEREQYYDPATGQWDRHAANRLAAALEPFDSPDWSADACPFWLADVGQLTKAANDGSRVIEELRNMQ